MLSTLQRLRSALVPKYGAGETEAIIRLIFHYLKGWSTVDMLINENKSLSPYIIEKIDGILARLLKDEPIQYIVGEAYFYGLELEVTRDVLIPRPETEELIDLVVSLNKKPDLRVLDACTGSGCISCALSRNLLYPNITALDISRDALEVAKSNFKKLKINNVEIVEADIFDYAPQKNSFDVIVSNPPYVMESEKQKIDANVLQYEPHRALFVSDDDPLVFYRRIAEIGRDALTENGKLFFEINPLKADSLRAMLEAKGYRDVEIVLDIHGKKRFLYCTKAAEQ